MNALRAPCTTTTTAAATTVFVCSLCGHRFTHGGRVCRACPLSSGCDVVACPQCGFQFPRASWIADGLARVWRRWRERT